MLAKLTRTARKIAAGDVNVEADIPQVSADELGILSQTFREMASSLQRVSLAAEAVAGGDLRSTHLSRGSQDGLGRAFEFMVDDLRRLVQAVITNASQITQSAQISAAARQIRFGFEVPGRQHRESGRVRDLGGGGISFESDIARTRGMPIAMSLDLERGAPIHAAGQIVSSEVEKSTGARVKRVAFTSISDDAREAVLEYILETRRQAIIAR